MSRYLTLYSNPVSCAKREATCEGKQHYGLVLHHMSPSLCSQDCIQAQGNTSLRHQASLVSTELSLDVTKAQGTSYRDGVRYLPTVNLISLSVPLPASYPSTASPALHSSCATKIETYPVVLVNGPTTTYNPPSSIITHVWMTRVTKTTLFV